MLAICYMTFSSDNSHARQNLPPRQPQPVAVAPMIGNYQLPLLDFLQPAAPTINLNKSEEELMAYGRLIQQTLEQFDVKVALGDITQGPTFTCFELHLAPGVRMERVELFKNELMAALAVDSLRILSPIPGKSTVGIEAPNRVRTNVILLDLFDTDEWRNTRDRIPIAIGRNVDSRPIIADLAEMPHLLIAGATGSGKSVCIHSIIVSLLYRFSPDQLRFVMIDPKVVELQQYNALPHLITPVVSTPQNALAILRWAVNELEKRFQIFALCGVRNILSFNDRLKTQPLFKGEDIVIPEKLPYIVIIIDALAELMRDAPVNLETAITRLLHLGHTVGIHCVLTVENSSSAVISGTTKAYLPTRLSFRLPSKRNSIVFFDHAGAEELLDKGDLLLRPAGSARLIRGQGAVISDKELQEIIGFIVNQGKPNYVVEIDQQLLKPKVSPRNESGIDEDEEIIQQCIEVIRSERKASVSLLQCRLQLGHARAARIMDELENRGIIGEYKGSEPREILFNLNDNGDARSPIELEDCGIIDSSQGSKPSQFLTQSPVGDGQTGNEDLAVYLCVNCGERIKVDVNEFEDRESVVVPCPHCNKEIQLAMNADEV